ncbi:MAG: hypothetical protein QOD75_134 [Blastocatellia bacterium]|jgi:hypothetical protein|nr:hypothetical protein [Blastocatellia bacterium]
MSKGYIYTTRGGFDPERGKKLKDPYLGDQPTLGACMPNIRRQVVPGDHIFLVSGKVKDALQFVMAGFEVDQKLDAMLAYDLYPQHRLRQLENGEVTGNIIVTAQGRQHPLDTHDPSTFARRIENYVTGRNPVVLTSRREIQSGRDDTLYVLSHVLGKKGRVPKDIMGRWSRLDDRQIRELRDWLVSIKAGH